jgi:hypothetical protein
MKIQYLDEKWNDVLMLDFDGLDNNLDCHDVILTPKGNFLFLVNRRAPGKITSPELIEVAKNGKLVFLWRLYDHYNIDIKSAPNNDDIVHANSISFVDDRYLLLSLRTPGEILKIDYTTGKITDRISSSTWNFSADSFGGFKGQHHVQALPDNHILLFDNQTKHRPSRAAEYALDFKAKSARLVWEYRADFSNSERLVGGSVQRLPNGNTLIGWGSVGYGPSSRRESAPLFTEVSPSGKKIRELNSSQNLTSYRVYFENTQGN